MKDNALYLKADNKNSKNSKPVTADWLWLREVSFGGWMLTGLALLLISSAYKSLRIPVGGLLIHLYLIPLIPLFVLYAVPRFNLFPKKILIALSTFVFLFFLSITVSSSNDTRYALNEIFKVGASLITVLTCALMVRTKFDYRIAGVGICIAAAILSFENIFAPGRTFDSDIATDIVEETIANKNAFSLYVLPSLLFGSFLVLDQTLSKILRAVLITCLFITTVAIVTSGNRSGWICTLLIGVVVFGKGRSLTSLLLICVIGIGTYYALTKFVGTEALERRVNQTVVVSETEETRLELIPTSIEIAFENPVFGISPQEIYYELGRRMPESAVLVNDVFILDTHNVFAFILAGSGFPAFIALVILGLVIWQRPPEWEMVLRHISDIKESHNILRTLLVLWLIRGMFTREILYSPAFNMALGLGIGFCVSQGVWIPKAIQFYRLNLALQKIRKKV